MVLERHGNLLADPPERDDVFGAEHPAIEPQIGRSDTGPQRGCVDEATGRAIRIGGGERDEDAPVRRGRFHSKQHAAGRCRCGLLRSDRYAGAHQGRQADRSTPSDRAHRFIPFAAVQRS
jgi:hypothetical protein